MKKQLKRILSSALVLALCLSALPVSAKAVSQSDVDALRAQRDAISAQREEKQAVVDELEAEQAGVLERKQAMDERNMYTLEQIRLNREVLAVYDQMIADKAQEVAAAKKLEEEQLERYRVRVRAMEENGGYGLLTLVLRTSNLGEFLTVMDDVGEIMESDRQVEDAYIEARKNTEAVQAEYEDLKSDLEEKQADLRREQEELQAEIEEATALIRALQEDIDANREEYEAIRAAEEEADRELNALIAELERQRQEELERQRREEQARQQAEAAKGGGSTGTAVIGGSVTGSGSFGWPCPGCTYVTSRAGNRFHPVYGEWRYHSGIDIGAGAGSAVVASDAGTVALAGVKGGYGNCVMIDHGNGYYTLYGHLSSFAVAEGQSISKGTTIGYVGDTGIATGPHLHFEIRQGASTPLDPEAVAGWTGLTYAPDAGD